MTRTKNPLFLFFFCVNCGGVAQNSSVWVSRDAITEASLSGSGREGSGDGGDDDKDVVVVCGTVFMMVDAREELGFDEPRVSRA